MSERISETDKRPRIVHFRNSAEASAHGSLHTARRILGQFPTWAWLLPWKIRTWLYLRHIIKRCERFLRSTGREDLI